MLNRNKIPSFVTLPKLHVQSFYPEVQSFYPEENCDGLGCHKGIDLKKCLREKMATLIQQLWGQIHWDFDPDVLEVRLSSSRA